jgi:hypothetical protein
MATDPFPVQGFSDAEVIAARTLHGRSTIGAFWPAMKGEAGQVNVSEATHALVKDALVSSPLSVGSAQDGIQTTDNLQRTTIPAFTFTPRGNVQA